MITLMLITGRAAVQYTKYMFCIPAAEKYIQFDVDIMSTTTDQSQRAV